MNHAGFLDKNMIVILNDNQQVRMNLVPFDVGRGGVNISKITLFSIEGAGLDYLLVSRSYGIIRSVSNTVPMVLG